MTGILRELTQGGVTVVFSSHQLDLVEDICEQVAIIDRGRVVLAGAVRALKHRGSPTLVLEIEGAGSDWYAGLPAAAVEHAGPGPGDLPRRGSAGRPGPGPRGRRGSAVRPRGALPLGVVPPGGRAMTAASAVRL